MTVYVFLLLVLVLVYAVVGLALAYWAKSFSVRYCAWAAGVRERHPDISPPPTPELRVRNTKVMTIIFRSVGVFFVLLSAIAFLTYLDSVAKRH
jgi:hypothetical protein